MSRKPRSRKTPPARTSDRELAKGLKKTLDAKYATVLEAAKRKWERQFGHKADPSDACVSVRVSGAQPKRRALPAPKKPRK